MVDNGCKNFPINFRHVKEPGHNLGQNNVDKFSELGKIYFSVKFFSGEFLQFCSRTVKIFISGDQLGTWLFSSKHFRSFLEIY